MRIYIGDEELTNRPDEWQVTDVQGLSPQDAAVTTSDRAWLDGATLTGARIGARTISLTVYPEDGPQEARLALYDLFPLKEAVAMRFETPLRRAVATGFVKRVECDLYTARQSVEVEVICPDPYLYAPSPVEADSGGVIRNPGLPVGIVAESAGGSVGDGERTFSLTTTNVPYVLDSREGSKSVKRQGTGTSLMSSIASGSKWPVAGRGETTITGATSAYIVPRWLGI